jgi:hypothetical protein
VESRAYWEPFRRAASSLKRKYPGVGCVSTGPVAGAGTALGKVSPMNRKAVIILVIIVAVIVLVLLVIYAANLTSGYKPY